MHILISPEDVAQKLRDYCHLDDFCSRMIVFGNWCREYQNLPESYMRKVCEHLLAD